MVLLAAVLGVAALLGGRALRGELFPMPGDRCLTTRFDAARWRDSAQVALPSAVRGCVVDDLLARHELRGQTRAAIVALLGEPTQTSYFNEYGLVYWLGPERGRMSIDSEWLVLRLDSSGRVSERRIVTD